MPDDTYHLGNCYTHLGPADVWLWLPHCLFWKQNVGRCQLNIRFDGMFKALNQPGRDGYLPFPPLLSLPTDPHKKPFGSPWIDREVHLGPISWISLGNGRFGWLLRNHGEEKGYLHEALMSNILFRELADVSTWSDMDDVLSINNRKLWT